MTFLLWEIAPQTRLHTNTSLRSPTTSLRSTRDRNAYLDTEDATRDLPNHALHNRIEAAAAGEVVERDRVVAVLFAAKRRPAQIGLIDDVVDEVVERVEIVEEAMEIYVSTHSLNIIIPKPLTYR